MTASADRVSPDVSGESLTITDFLDLGECFEKLASRHIGRVVFSQGALPVVTPARYALSGRDLYLATGPDAEQHVGITGAVITFEVDELDPETGHAWSVTVTGIAESCTHPSRWPLIVRLGLAPHDGHWASVFRLPPGIVSGRRFAAEGLVERESP